MPAISALVCWIMTIVCWVYIRNSSFDLQDNGKYSIRPLTEHEKEVIMSLLVFQFFFGFVGAYLLEIVGIDEYLILRKIEKASKAETKENAMDLGSHKRGGI